MNILGGGSDSTPRTDSPVVVATNTKFKACIGFRAIIAMTTDTSTINTK